MKERGVKVVPPGKGAAYYVFDETVEKVRSAAGEYGIEFERTS